MYARVHRKGTISTEKIVGSVNAEKMHPKKLAKSTAAVRKALLRHPGALAGVVLVFGEKPGCPGAKALPSGAARL